MLEITLGRDIVVIKPGNPIQIKKPIAIIPIKKRGKIQQVIELATDSQCPVWRELGIERRII